MRHIRQWVALLKLLFAAFHSTYSSSIYDPHRVVLSHGKTVVQSSTEGTHVASLANDGDYNFDLPIKCSKTMTSDNPYLQVDLGDTRYIHRIYLAFPYTTVPAEVYTNIQVTFGPDAAVGSSNNAVVMPSTSCSKWKIIDTRRWGRYITVQRLESNTELSLCEVSAIHRPIENLAYRKGAKSSAYVYGRGPHHALDGGFDKFYETKNIKKPWFQVDLGDTYFVHEVLIFARIECCGEKRLTQFEIRIGDNSDSNFNPLCSNGDMFTQEIRSFYCDMFGRFVNVKRQTNKGVLQFSAIMVNTEKTVNVAFQKSAYSDTDWMSKKKPECMVDGRLGSCLITKAAEKEKKAWVELQEEKTITMVYIVSSGLVDFELKIGNSFATSSHCVPGLQKVPGPQGVAFYCEQRLTGTHVIIQHRRTDRSLEVCEIAVFEETKPAIVGLTSRYIWAEENKDLTLTCDVRGYPTPVVSWVKDKVVVQSGSGTLLFQNGRFNQSGTYECWANNTYGVDARRYHIRLTNKLRVCTEHLEKQYNLRESAFTGNNEVEGTQWYSVYDAEGKKFLQFRESSSAASTSCKVWLNGKHPKVSDGVVSRTLCVKNDTNDCSATIDVYIRLCPAHYIYKFKNLRSMSEFKFCFKNAPDFRENINPVIASPKYNHALSNKILQRDTEMNNSYQCLMMCQLEPRCKSFNFSQKLKICELNTATKSEFPGSFGHRSDYDYYHMGKGISMRAKQEL